MRRIGKIFVGIGLGALAFTSACTCVAGEIMTRSVADANADLMRTYQSFGGPPAGMVHSRNLDDAMADLVRNWNAKPSTVQGPAVGSRNVDEDYMDLMRLPVRRTRR